MINDRYEKQHDCNLYFFRYRQPVEDSGTAAKGASLGDDYNLETNEARSAKKQQNKDAVVPESSIVQGNNYTRFRFQRGIIRFLYKSQLHCLCIGRPFTLVVAMVVLKAGHFPITVIENQEYDCEFVNMGDSGDRSDGEFESARPTSFKYCTVSYLKNCANPPCIDEVIYYLWVGGGPFRESWS